MYNTTKLANLRIRIKTCHSTASESSIEELAQGSDDDDGGTTIRYCCITTVFRSTGLLLYTNASTVQ